MKRIQKYTVEDGDKEYDRENILIEHYQYEEMYKQNNPDCIMLKIRNGSIDLTIKATCFGGIEGILKSSYSEILYDRRVDYTLSYKKHNINVIISHFDGYTGLHLETECISMKEQLEHIRNDNSLAPYWDCIPKEVPILEKFKEDVYKFLR